MTCWPRRRWLQLAAALGGGVLSSLAAGAEGLPGLIAAMKPSVVLVGSHGMLDAPRFTFSGTGFAVADGLHVVTNAHVVQALDNPAAQRQVAVMVWSVESGWQLRVARLVSTDVRYDVAVLRVEGPAIRPLPLAEREVAEGTTIALMGFPLGGALGFSHVTHRGIIAARTAIVPPASNAQGLNERAVRQLRQGAFEVLQLDATAYPGNSGGPVVDVASGEVVGVVSMVLVKGTREAALNAPSGITYAIPAQDVRRLVTAAVAVP